MITPSPKQQQIRDAEALDMLIVAPAGCGKTEALALRVQGMLARGAIKAPKKVLVVTFSTRARDNIKERLRDYLPPAVLRDRVTVTNFHGLSARLIRAHGNVIGLPPDVKIQESDWVSEQVRRLSLSWDDQAAVKDTLSRVKRQPLDDSGVAHELDRIGNSAAIGIEQQRVDENVLTYDDLPRLAEVVLQNEDVARLYSTHFGAVIVDEFQDLTPQQLRIVNHIGKGRTTYAGDLAQGIYVFAGAEPETVDKSIREECGTVIEFSESHRSSPAVLTMVNSLVDLTSGTTLTAADPNSWPSGGFGASVVHVDAHNEASWLPKFVGALLDKVPDQRVGVIARTSKRRRFIDEAFANTNLPHYRWDDGLLDTETAKIVRAMLSRFDHASFLDASDKVAFLREAAGVGSVEDIDVLKTLIEALGWVQDLLTQGLLPKDIRARIKVGETSTLITKSGVHLLSGHIGKGQQFDWVVVVGLEEDFIPFSMAKTPKAIAEEARILSVMISRARHGVLLSRAQNVPTNSDSPKSRAPSRFLSAINTIPPLNKEQLLNWYNTADWSAIAKK